jgi:hypothetical protein
VQRELTDLSAEVWQRLWRRLDGLTDDEYFWEPAPGCWTVRRRADGTWIADWPLPRPDPEPFTTIAWRLWHLIDMYGEDRAPRWLAVPTQGPAVGFDGDEAPPGRAVDALEMLDRAHDRWEAHLALTTDARLAEPVGPVAGPGYADRSRAGYVFHMLDEFIHHGAELSLLRDLWRWQHPLGSDDRAERIMRGDLTLLDEVDAADLTAEVLDRAAAYGRWDLVLGLLERGAPLSTTGRTVLHSAAGAGEAVVVAALLERGADPTARDPEYHATPRQWAEFLRHPEVAALLRDDAR